MGSRWTVAYLKERANFIGIFQEFVSGFNITGLVPVIRLQLPPKQMKQADMIEFIFFLIPFMLVKLHGLVRSFSSNPTLPTLDGIGDVVAPSPVGEWSPGSTPGCAEEILAAVPCISS